MMGNGSSHPGPLLITRENLPSLLDRVAGRGYEIIGPVFRDGAIVYDTVDRVEDLPAGCTDVQAGGTYRIEPGRPGSLFDYAVGPHSWKSFLHPPRLRLWSASREKDGFRITPEETPAPRVAFLGVRPCELAAIRLQDRIFLEGRHVDPAYRARREAAFLIAVQCGSPADTCFCTSLGTGPRADTGFDLALTETRDEDRHVFLLETGTERGAEMVEDLGFPAASTADLEAARGVTDRAAGRIERRMNPLEARALLARNTDNAHWRAVAERCLACGNCTLACPTCFCTTVEDHTDLTGRHAERWRQWDSCFSADFTFIHGGSVRRSIKSRYRQWLTHKLSSWYDQFDSSGCVGCGRCITWCPVGIDLTREIAELRSHDVAKDPVAVEV